MERTIKCEQCGREFVTHGYNSKICSDECRRIRYAIFSKTHHYDERNRKGEQERREKKKASSELRKRTAKNKGIESMAEINRKAREMGLTYGQYMALQTADMLRHDRKE